MPSRKYRTTSQSRVRFSAQYHATIASSRAVRPLPLDRLVENITQDMAPWSVAFESIPHIIVVTTACQHRPNQNQNSPTTSNWQHLPIVCTWLQFTYLSRERLPSKVKVGVSDCCRFMARWITPMMLPVGLPGLVTSQSCITLISVPGHPSLSC